MPLHQREVKIGSGEGNKGTCIGNFSYTDYSDDLANSINFSKAENRTILPIILPANQKLTVSPPLIVLPRMLYP